MTPERDVSRETSSPWRQYLDQEHAARNQYLATVQAAHREYLAGPNPDRDYYLTVERDAWATYYRAGHDAWKRYRAAMETHPPDIVTLGPLATAARDEWLARNPQYANQPPPASHPYPLPDRAGSVGDLRHGQATFTPYPGNGQPDQPDQWPGNYLADGPRPDTRDHEGRIIMWAEPPRVTDRPETES